MAVAVERERVADVHRYRFTVDEFARMGEARIFTEDDRVELVDGEILEMTPIGPLHAWIVDRLTELIVTRVAGKVHVRIQNPVRLGSHTEPQPDLVVARRSDAYTDRHPEPGRHPSRYRGGRFVPALRRAGEGTPVRQGRHSGNVGGGRGGARRQPLHRCRSRWICEPGRCGGAAVRWSPPGCRSSAFQSTTFLRVLGVFRTES